MPRNIPSDLLDHLRGEVLTVAYLTRIERLDGTILGFASCDSDIDLDSVTYKAETGVDASAARSTLGSGVDNVDVRGLLDDDRVTDEDIRAGLYQGASVTIFLINYEDLTMGTAIILDGFIGRIRLLEGQYYFEIRSKMQKLAQKVGEVTTLICRVKSFGDAQCGVDLGPHTFTETVTAVVQNRHLTFTLPNTELFNYGLVRFNTGANAGLQREIKDFTDLGGGELQLHLQLAFPLTIQVGDEADIIAGCDRRLATCDFYDNTDRFQGEPYVPGNRKLQERGKR